jgi:GxxExxY protein
LTRRSAPRARLGENETTDEHRFTLMREEMKAEQRQELSPQGGIFPEQELTGKIIGAAFAVHNDLGAGFLEKVYSNALAIELGQAGISCEREVPFKVRHRNMVVGDYCADIVVEQRVLVGLKACVGLDSVHEAQILNYLKASGIRVGLLMNFGQPRLQYRRFVL